MCNLAKAKKDISEIGKRLYLKGFASGLSGNISVKIDNKILITPSGFNLGDVKQKDIVIIDTDGNKIKGKHNPSSEKQMHVEIYKQRQDINAIVHAHTPKASSFAVAGIPLDKAILSEASVILGHVPVAEYGMPSSDELAKSVASYFKNYSCVLMANHGVVTGGQNLRETYYKLETLELYAEVFLWTKVLGNSNELSEENYFQLMKKFVDHA